MENFDYVCLILSLLVSAAIILPVWLHERAQDKKRADIHRASFKPKIVMHTPGAPFEAGVSRTPAAPSWSGARPDFRPENWR